MSRFKSNRAIVTRVHGKLGQVCEPVPGHASNQIEQQQKITMHTQSAKFHNIFLLNFAEFLQNKKN
jgi:hypothetical protein